MSVSLIKSRIRQIPGVTGVIYGEVKMGGSYEAGFSDREPGFFVHSDGSQRAVDIQSAAAEVAGPKYRISVVDQVESAPTRAQRAL